MEDLEAALVVRICRLLEDGAALDISKLGGKLFGQNQEQSQQVRDKWGTFTLFLESRLEFDVLNGFDGTKSLRLREVAEENDPNQVVQLIVDLLGPLGGSCSLGSLLSGQQSISSKVRDTFGSLKRCVRKYPNLFRLSGTGAAEVVTLVATLKPAHTREKKSPNKACDLCGKGFATAKSLARHVAMKHKKPTITQRALRNSLKIETLPSPVSADGHWVLRADFPFEKSFGWYECESEKCMKTWLSAHSFKKFKQGCKKCDTYQLPKFLWLNTDNDERSSADENSKGPHDSARCEACGRGVCDGNRGA